MSLKANNFQRLFFLTSKTFNLLQCPSGGGYFIGHDIVCAEVADLAGGNEGIPGAAVDWQPKVDAWPRSTRGYEADVSLYYLPGLRYI